MKLFSASMPVVMKPAEAEISADRAAVFRYVTPFVRQAQSAEWTVVRRDDDGRYLVEFRPEVRIFASWKRRFRSVEWVTLHETYEIEFEHHEGALSLLHDRFLLADTSAGTRLHYESTFGVSGWIAGWAVAYFILRPIMQRFMNEHVKGLKEGIERRRVTRPAK